MFTRLAFFTCAGAVGAALFSPAPARAEGETPVAVLGIEATDAPEQLATELTDALRQRVATTRGFQLVPGKDLVEIKLVFSCPDEAPSCMAQAAKSLGAAKLLFGSVKRSTSGDFVVGLKFLDANTAVVDSWVAEPLPQKQANAGAMRGPVQKWFAALTGQNATGIIRVRSSTPGASVSIDGNNVATTGKDDVIVTDVPPGRHEVKMEKPGFRPVKQTVDLQPGTTLLVPLRLGEAPGAPVVTAAPGLSSAPPPAPDDGHSSYRTAFWITLAAGLASGGAAVKFGLDVVDSNNKLDYYRRFPCSSSTGWCDNAGKPAAPVTAAKDLQAVSDLKDQGSRAQALQWVFIGVGSAFGVASAYLLYKGYLDTTPAPGMEHAGNRGLRIFPTVGGGGGGVLAEFDF